MADVKTERLSRQLKAQAEAILKKTGVELAQDLLVTCSALLRLAGESADPQKLEKLDLDLLTDDYQSVADHVSVFIKKSGLDISKNDALIQGAGETLKHLREESARLERDVQKQLDDVKTCRMNNESLQGELEKRRKEMQELETVEKGLREALSAYPPELFDKLKEQNTDLYDQVTAKKAEFEKADQERIEQERALAELQGRIDALPDTLKKLREDMDALEATLARIEKAEETCSPEKQAEAQAEIEKLERQLEKDKAAQEKLTKKLEELRACEIVYDSEAQSLQTAAITLMNETIRDLRPKLEKHQKALEQIQDTNKQLEESYRNCNELLESYKNWFTSDLTPLEKLMEALKEEGSLHLKGTLSISNCENIRKAFDEIRDKLDYLDGVLEKAAQAYGFDVKHLNNRARGKTPK